MSKYYTVEDVIAFLNLYCPKDMWEYQIADLPTIEVSEDCISREYLEEQYWQTLIPKEVINTDIELGINIGITKMHENIKNAPSVLPKPKEGECPYFIDGVWCNLVGKKMKGAE